MWLLIWVYSPANILLLEEENTVYLTSRQSIHSFAQGNYYHTTYPEKHLQKTFILHLTFYNIEDLKEGQQWTTIVG